MASDEETEITGTTAAPEVTGRHALIPASAGGRVLVGLMLVALFALFGWQTREHFFLGDDGYIAFRYSERLAEGRGLTWNDGERVEGYTQFVWVVIVAAAIRLGFTAEGSSAFFGISSGAVLVAAFLFFCARRRGWRDPLTWLPAILLCASESFAAWCSGGLETMQFGMFVLLAVLAWLREAERSDELPWRSSVLFVLATLSRPEAGMFTLVCGVFFLVDVLRGQRSWRALVTWAGLWFLLFGAYFLWRYNYFGYPLPNTFYAKVNGNWAEQGLLYLSLFHESYQAGWCLPLVALALMRRERTAWLFLAATVLYVYYVVTIGGDRFEFRFLVVVLPFFYWLLAEGLGRLSGWVGKAGMPVSVLAGLVLVALTWRGGMQASKYHVVTIHDIEVYANIRARQGMWLRQKIDEGKLPADLIVAVGGAGALPFYTQWPTIDRHGLNDVEIAHSPIQNRGAVAHEHDATYEYLVRREVVVYDVFNRFLFSTFENKRDFHYEHDGHVIPIRAIEIDGRFFIFGSMVSDEKLREVFAPYEILM